MSCWAWLGLVVDLPRDPRAHIQLFQASGWNVSSRKAWPAIWMAVVHCLWAHRNAAVFHGLVSSVHCLFGFLL